MLLPHYRKILLSLTLACSHSLFAHDHHSHGEDPCCHDEHMIALTDEQIVDAGILTSKVTHGNIVQYIRASGKVSLPPQAIVHVISRVPGIVSQVFNRVGDEVNEGDILALVESKEMAEIKADYIAAKCRHDLKQNLLQKERTLHAQKLLSDIDFWEKESALEEAQIQKDLCRQKLLALGLSAKEIENLRKQNPETLRFYELKAPMSGIVIESEFAPGEYINIDTDFVVIGDLKQSWLEIDVPTPQQNLIKASLPVRATNPQGDSCTSQLLCYKPVLEETTRCLKAYAPINYTEHPWPVGTYVTALINGESLHFPVVIPKTAIQQVDGNSVVFIANEEGFEIRPVVLGPSDDERVAVVDGLHRGEKIAVTNSFLLKAEHEKDEAEHEH